MHVFCSQQKGWESGAGRVIAEKGAPGCLSSKSEARRRKAGGCMGEEDLLSKAAPQNLSLKPSPRAPSYLRYRTRRPALRPGRQAPADLATRALSPPPSRPACPPTWAKMMAGGMFLLHGEDAGGAGGLEMATEAVAMLQQRAFRRRLEHKLAAVQQHLARPLLSYEQLLAYFVDWALQLAILTEGDDALTTVDKSQATMAVRRAAVELLPKLTPDNPRYRLSAVAASLRIPSPQHRNALQMTHDAMRVAEEQRSDIGVASCGYQIAQLSFAYADSDLAALQGTSPSDVVTWLQQAEAAHRRCKGVLPRMWTLTVEESKAAAMPLKSWLQQLQQEGDRFRPMPMNESRELTKKYEEDLKLMWESPLGALDCDGCGRSAVQLRRCSNYKETQYCR